MSSGHAERPDSLVVNWMTLLSIIINYHSDQVYKIKRLTRRSMVKEITRSNM